MLDLPWDFFRGLVSEVRTKSLGKHAPDGTRCPHHGRADTVDSTARRRPDGTPALFSQVVRYSAPTAAPNPVQHGTSRTPNGLPYGLSGTWPSVR